MQKVPDTPVDDYMFVVAAIIVITTLSLLCPLAMECILTTRLRIAIIRGVGCIEKGRFWAQDPLKCTVA